MGAALGLIEVKGLVAAVEVLDTMVKSAEVVNICNKTSLGGGLVTLVVRGDVGAVNAAIEAGREVADRFNGIFCSKVIAAPHPDIVAILEGGK